MNVVYYFHCNMYLPVKPLNFLKLCLARILFKAIGIATFKIYPVIFQMHHKNCFILLPWLLSVLEKQIIGCRCLNCNRIKKIIQVNNIFVNTIKFYLYIKPVMSYITKNVFVITLKISYKIFRLSYCITIIHIW